MLQSCPYILPLECNVHQRLREKLSGELSHRNSDEWDSYVQGNSTVLGESVGPRLRESRLLTPSGRGGELTQPMAFSFIQLCTLMVFVTFGFCGGPVISQSIETDAVVSFDGII